MSMIERRDGLADFKGYVLTICYARSSSRAYGMESSSSVRAQIRLGFKERIPLQVDLRSLQKSSRFLGAASEKEVVKRSVSVYCRTTHLL